MRRLTSLLIVFVLLLASMPAMANKYGEARRVFMNAGESSAYFRNSYGYALFPTIGKVGIGIGGAHGNGRVYVNGKTVGTTSMTQVTVGLQLGGQAYSQIIFFKDRRAFQEFASGNFEFGAQASAVAITASANASANTAGGIQGGASGTKDHAETVGGYYKGMAVFTVAKGGLMYEASIGGQKFSYTPL